MLKNISNLGTVLNKSEQQQVKGGVRGSQPWEMCWKPQQCSCTPNGEYGDTLNPDCGVDG